MPGCLNMIAQDPAYPQAGTFLTNVIRNAYMAIKLANGFSEHKLRIMFPSSKHLQLKHRVFIYKIMIRKT